MSSILKNQKLESDEEVYREQDVKLARLKKWADILLSSGIEQLKYLSDRYDLFYSGKITNNGLLSGEGTLIYHTLAICGRFAGSIPYGA